RPHAGAHGHDGRHDAQWREDLHLDPLTLHPSPGGRGKHGWALRTLSTWHGQGPNWTTMVSPSAGTERSKARWGRPFTNNRMRPVAPSGQRSPSRYRGPV